MSQDNNSQDQMQTFLVILVVLLVAAIGYLIFKPSDEVADTDVTDNQDTTVDVDETEGDEVVVDDVDADESEDDVDGEEPADDADEDDVEPPQSAPEEALIPDGWKEIENTTYGYTAYRPSNFYYRFFGSASLLGIDPNVIPEASSYAGSVTMMALSGDLETAMADYYSSFLAIMDTTEDQGNGTWSLISAEIPENEMDAAKNVMCAFIEVDGQVFVVDYRYDASGDAIYEGVFDKFYPAIEFDN
jgi:hypothetical protein